MKVNMRRRDHHGTHSRCIDRNRSAINGEDCKISIHVYLTDKRAAARVVFVDPSNPRYCGIEIDEPRNIFGSTLDAQRLGRTVTFASAVSIRCCEAQHSRPPLASASPNPKWKCGTQLPDCCKTQENFQLEATQLHAHNFGLLVETEAAVGLIAIP
jgi:hypothetical protein